MNGATYPTCGWLLRWLPEQNAWGCDRCRKLVSPPRPPPAGALPPQARKRSGKGLVIGLGAGAGVVIAVVVATGGGGGAGSRDELVKARSPRCKRGTSTSSKAHGYGGAHCRVVRLQRTRCEEWQRQPGARARDAREENAGPPRGARRDDEGLKLELVSFDTAKKRKRPDEIRACEEKVSARASGSCWGSAPACSRSPV